MHECNLEVIFQKQVRVFHRGFKHEKTDESTSRVLLLLSSVWKSWWKSKTTQKFALLHFAHFNALYVWFVLISRHSLYLWAFGFKYQIVSRCTKVVLRSELQVIYISLVFAMAEGRFRFPITIEEEELCVERAVPKSNRY